MSWRRCCQTPATTTMSMTAVVRASRQSEAEFGRGGGARGSERGRHRRGFTRRSSRAAIPHPNAQCSNTSAPCTARHGTARHRTASHRTTHPALIPNAHHLVHRRPRLGGAAGLGQHVAQRPRQHPVKLREELGAALAAAAESKQRFKVQFEAAAATGTAASVRGSTEAKRQGGSRAGEGTPAGSPPPTPTHLFWMMSLARYTMARRLDWSPPPPPPTAPAPALPTKTSSQTSATRRASARWNMHQVEVCSMLCAEVLSLASLSRYCASSSSDDDDDMVGGG